LDRDLKMNVPENVDKLLAIQVPLNTLERNVDSIAYRLMVKYGRHLNHLHELILTDEPEQHIQKEMVVCDDIYDEVFAERYAIVDVMTRLHKEKKIEGKHADDVQAACMIVAYLNQN